MNIERLYLMELSKTLSRHFFNLYFSDNWTEVNIKDLISDLSFEEAQHQVSNLNTIATLVFHINYYADKIGDFLETGELKAKDADSFKGGKITSEAEWETLKEKIERDGKRFSQLIAKVDSETLSQDFYDEKYGSYLTNLLGILEHFYYHMGQIRLIKKLIRNSSYTK